MKRLLFAAVITLLVFTAGSAAWYVNKLHHNGTANAHTTAAVTIADNTVKNKLDGIAIAAKQYAAGNKFNMQFCFLIDMSIASGKQRFFVYDMKKNIVLATGLVTHGRCNQDWLAGRKYGNTLGCGCTSLGKYKVGVSYKGRFGLAYKLYGLDATNSNAYSRFVVLHSMQCVPEEPVEPYPICQSDGCPTVSPGFLKDLAVLIEDSKQPMLLWIYE
ncbi:MAG: murein L,D-transpeptidase catalytic domain-containing protein [Chitinophagaceae bacterium]